MKKKLALRILIIGTALAVVLVAAAYIFMNTEQCPAGYSQAQVDASSCIVGANIGQGLVFLLAVAVEALAVVSALIVYIIQRLRH